MTASRRTIPEGLDLITAPQGIVIRKVWRTWKIIPLAIFAIAWDSFLFFWYTKALSAPNAPLMAIIFPIGHVAAGIGITYYVIASLVNKTDVTISPSGVQIQTGPAWWIGNKEVPLDEISQVIVRERSMNRNGRTYNVMYADRSRKERKLVAWISQSDQAEFIADTIRETLGLAADSR